MTTNVRKTLYRRRNAAYANQLKSETACADCHHKYPPHVMQFDHLGDAPKVADISVLVNHPSSLEKLQAEIAKCEIVCANCHADRTHQRRLKLITPGP